MECLTCGHVQPTAEGRCPRCGTRLTQLQKPPAAPPRAEQPIVLPNTPAARRFVEAAGAVEAELERRVQDDVTGLARAQKSVTDMQEQVHQDSRAVSAFRGLLGIIRVSDERPKPGPKPKAEARQPIADSTPARWSQSYDACRRCGRTSVKHLARGYCQTCYPKVPKEDR